MSQQIGLLFYDVQPPAVFVGQQVDLALAIFNSCDGAPVVFHGGRPQDADQLQIGFVTSGSGALTDNLDFTAAVTAQPPLPDPPDGAVPFTVVLIGTNFFVKPQGTNPKTTSTLAPGQSLTVTFSGVRIASTPGTGDIVVTQLLGGSSPSGTLRVAKKPLTPGIVAWLDPPLITGGATSTLRWTAVGGSTLEVVGFPYGTGTRTFPLSGTPPVSGETTVMIQQGAHTQPYTLNVIKPGTGTVASAQVTLQNHRPFVSEFAPVGELPAALPVDRQVTLRYVTVFAATAELISPLGARPLPVPASGSAVVAPGADAYRIGGNSANIPPTLDYTLKAQGYSTPDSRTIRVTLAPIRVLYFKYLVDKDGVLSGAQAKLVPDSWPGQAVASRDDGVLVLTVWGPGGQVVQQYLGSGDTVHPQIQYFDAQPPAGGNVTVSWVSANLTALVLDPGGHAIPAGDVAKGQATIPLGGAGELVLTGTSASGASVQSVILLGSTAGGGAGP